MILVYACLKYSNRYFSEITKKDSSRYKSTRIFFEDKNLDESLISHQILQFIDLTKNEDYIDKIFFSFFWFKERRYSKGFYLKLLKVFQEKGYVLEKPIPGFSSPLHLAVLIQDLNLVDALLELGVDPDIIDFSGHLPITYAYWHANEDLISIIMNYSKVGDLELLDLKKWAIINKEKPIILENKEVWIRNKYTKASFIPQSTKSTSFPTNFKNSGTR